MYKFPTPEEVSPETEEAFMECTFNEIDPSDLPKVMATFNDWLDNNLVDGKVEKIEFDGCEDVRIVATHKTVDACCETTMYEIMQDLL